jgi:hypothetical protein
MFDGEVDWEIIQAGGKLVGQAGKSQVYEKPIFL